MRIAFMGTPDFAVPSLRALVAAGHDVVAVYTQPPRPANRGKHLSPSIIQTVADELGLAVFSPHSLRDPPAQADFSALNLDIAVVAAYGLILPQAILDAPKFGCLNVHGSLLPRWRGAAPVQRAILAGDIETGVEIMQMAAGLDTGDVRASARTAVADKNMGELTNELADLGAALMVQVLADMPGHPPVPQPTDGMTYAAKIDKAETQIDFAQSAIMVERQIRAFNPAPGAWFEYSGDRYRILAADIVNQDGAIGTVLDAALTIACAAGAIRPTKIQRAGKPVMTPAELLRGNPIAPGTQLS